MFQRPGHAQAHVVSSRQKAVLRVVRKLAVFNGVAIVALPAYTHFLNMPFSALAPLVLTAVLASIPVGTLAVAGVFGFVLDALKIPVSTHLEIA